MFDFILDFLVQHKENIPFAFIGCSFLFFFANVILPYIYNKIIFKDFYDD